MSFEQLLKQLDTTVLSGEILLVVYEGYCGTIPTSVPPADYTPPPPPPQMYGQAHQSLILQSQTTSQRNCR